MVTATDVLLMNMMIQSNMIVSTENLMGTEVVHVPIASLKLYVIVLVTLILFGSLERDDHEKETID